MTPPDDLPPVLTVAEYAAYVRVGYTTAIRLCGAGRVPGAVKVGGVWRVPRSAVPASLRPAPAESETAAERAARVKASRARIEAMRGDPC